MHGIQFSYRFASIILKQFACQRWINYVRPLHIGVSREYEHLRYLILVLTLTFT